MRFTAKSSHRPFAATLGASHGRSPPMLLLKMASASLVAVALAGSVLGQDACSCGVTNAPSVTTASGTCTVPGYPPLPCLSYSVGSVPGAGLPAAGRCLHRVGEQTVCSPLTSCTFQPVRLVITAAPCFNSCGGGSSLQPVIEPATYAPNPIPSISAGQTENYDIKSPGAAACGDPEVDVTVKFKAKKLHGDV